MRMVHEHSATGSKLPLKALAPSGAAGDLARRCEIRPSSVYSPRFIWTRLRDHPQITISSCVAPAADRLSRTRSTSGGVTWTPDSTAPCVTSRCRASARSCGKPADLSTDARLPATCPAAAPSSAANGPAATIGPPWHDQGDCRHHSAAQFSQECRRSRIFKVHAGRRVHSFSKDPRVGVAVCDDGECSLLIPRA